MKLLEKNLLDYMSWILLDKNDFEKLTNENTVTFHSSKNEKHLLPIVKNDLKVKLNYKQKYYFIEPQEEFYLVYWGGFQNTELDGIEAFFSEKQFYVTIK